MGLIRPSMGLVRPSMHLIRPSMGLRKNGKNTFKHLEKSITDPLNKALKPPCPRRQKQKAFLPKNKSFNTYQNSCKIASYRVLKIGLSSLKSLISPLNVLIRPLMGLIRP